MSFTTIPLKTIIKLKKGCYNKDHTDYKCDLLVTISRDHEEYVVVRYPDGYTTTVAKDDILINSMCLPNHPGYNKRALNMPAFLIEFERNGRYQNYLALNNPELYAEALGKLNNTTVAPEPEQPEQTEQPTEVTTISSTPYLKSIDEKLGLILNLLRELVNE